MESKKFTTKINTFKNRNYGNYEERSRNKTRTMKKMNALRTECPL